MRVSKDRARKSASSEHITYFYIFNKAFYRRMLCAFMVLSVLGIISCVFAQPNAPSPNEAGSIPTASVQRYPYTAEIVGDDVHVRSGPGMRYRVVDQVNRGERLVVLERSHGWYRVRMHGGDIGWVMGKYTYSIRPAAKG